MLSGLIIFLILNIPFWILISVILRRHPKVMRIILGNILFEIGYIAFVVWYVINFELFDLLPRALYWLIIFILIHFLVVLFYAILNKKTGRDVPVMEDVLDDEM